MNQVRDTIFPRCVLNQWGGLTFRSAEASDRTSPQVARLRPDFLKRERTRIRRRAPGQVRSPRVNTVRSKREGRSAAATSDRSSRVGKEV